MVAAPNPLLAEFLSTIQSQTYRNVRVSVQNGDITERRTLEALAIPSFQHVIVLSEWYEGTNNIQQVDARTLITLLHLRKIAEAHGHPFSIVSEMLDLRNRELAEATQVDDFIVSEHLISLMMAQLSENAELFDVFTDIFDPEGAEIYLKPVTDYVAPGTSVDFYTVTEAARRRGETPLGYRISAEANDASKAYGIHTNPKKSEMVTFSPEDKVIVIAEN